MDYNQAIAFLYNQTPQFERIGAAAYKPGLETTRRLDDAFGNPHRRYRTVHVAGTNGKGSTAHTLAAILQSQGYKVGLYTSPHLVSFRERIRVNGAMIPDSDVVDFIERNQSMDFDGSPSFFELTTIMAFDHFARQGVDIAVIETGLGGRLDSTNIITPMLSVITNISKDHTAQLGDTLEAIAGEKAGIIKPEVPVVLGGIGDDLKPVFYDKARETGSKVILSEPLFKSFTHRTVTENHKPYIEYSNTPFGKIMGELTGECQPENAATIMTAAMALDRLGVRVSAESVADGFAKVCEMTGLMGRWMTVAGNPAIIMDTGHNIGGWEYLSTQLSGINDIIIGFVKDKDIRPILRLMPQGHRYYFTAPDIPRGLPATDLREIAQGEGLDGQAYDNVGDAIEAAREAAGPDSKLFLGGSNYLVGEALEYLSVQG